MKVDTAICHESDLVVARRHVRVLAQLQQMGVAKTEALATAVTEIARNILIHAVHGEMHIASLVDGPRHGITVTLSDDGPGIVDIDRAMQDGFSTGVGLGLGLAGAKRMVDEFEIASDFWGTVVTLRQWAP